MKTVNSTTKIIENVSAEEIFKIWIDVKNWHKFNHGIKSADLTGNFIVGNFIDLTLPNNKKVKLQITEVTKNKSFTDVTTFPLAKMYGIHEIIEENGKILLNATIKIEGILSFLWEKLVANKVASKIEDDMNSLIKLVKDGK